MREHIEDILVGGRPMTDVEIELQKRINKAMEFLEPFIEFGDSITLKGSMLNPVYEILKGEKNE